MKCQSRGEMAAIYLTIVLSFWSRSTILIRTHCSKFPWCAILASLEDEVLCLKCYIGYLSVQCEWKSGDTRVNGIKKISCSTSCYIWSLECQYIWVHHILYSTPYLRNSLLAQYSQYRSCNIFHHRERTSNLISAFQIQISAAVTVTVTAGSAWKRWVEFEIERSNHTPLITSLQWR